MQSLISDLSQQWHSNQRLRLGVVLVAGILFVYLVMLLNDHKEALSNAYLDQQKRLHSYAKLNQQSGWPEKVLLAQNTLVQEQSLLWTAASRGLAQATLQTWLSTHLKRFKLDKLKTDVSNPTLTDAETGVWLVRAEIKGLTDKQGLIALIREIELNNLLMSIDQLDIKKTRVGERLNMIISVYFILSEQAEST